MIDISMPILNGLEAAKQLQKANCRARIVFLTVHEDPDFLTAAFGAKAAARATSKKLGAVLQVLLVG